MSKRQLGPVLGATLLTQDIVQVIEGYCHTLGFTLVTQDKVSQELAEHWHAPALLGNSLAILASSDGKGWLRVVEDKYARLAKPLKSHGWMSLETNVANVDKLREKLTSDAFTIIGEPAYLQVSDAIKAMQVIGPAGEVSYLTQVDRAVPLSSYL